MGDTRRRPHRAGSIVRGIVLVALVVVVAPAVVADGDVLAMPAVALVGLAAIAVAVVGLVYWLVTVGAPAGWVTRRAHGTWDRCVIGEVARRHSSLSQFDLRAAATAARLSNEHGLMLTLNMAGIRSMPVLGVTLA